MDELGPLFEAPTDSNGLAVLIGVLAGVTVLITLVAIVRGRVLSDHRFTGAYAATLLLLPAFSYVLGDLYLLEESKKVEFCGSCHETMSPLVEAMRTDGDSLSAIHYQIGAVSHREACYQCHSGYGLYGTAEAKLSGVRHMIKTVTGRYTYPLEVHGKFDIDSCRNCHATSKPFRAVEAQRE